MASCVSLLQSIERKRSISRRSFSGLDYRSSGRLTWSDHRKQEEKRPKKWRRRRDSNPRNARTLNGFQDRRIQPLCHSSAAGRFLFYSPRKNASPVMKLPALRPDMVNQLLLAEGASFSSRSPYMQVAMVNIGSSRQS